MLETLPQRKKKISEATDISVALVLHSAATIIAKKKSPQGCSLYSRLPTWTLPCHAVI